MRTLLIAVLLSTLTNPVTAQVHTCPEDNLAISCPTTESKPPASCSGPSLTTTSIIRCLSGCPALASCSDILLSSDPVGPKPGALCWEDPDGAGNAQCTYDCISVVALNGTVFYPVGCKSLNDNGTAPTTSGEASSRFHPLATSAAVTSRHVTLAPGPEVVSKTIESSSGAVTTTGGSSVASSTSTSVSGNVGVGRAGATAGMPRVLVPVMMGMGMGMGMDFLLA